MTKSELINRMADQHPNLQHADMERVINTIFEEITQALARGQRVELRGFGAFSIRERHARTSRNPRTGASVQVAAKRTPFFKMGKELKERINRSGS